jgi:hypothetical protein
MRLDRRWPLTTDANVRLCVCFQGISETDRRVPPAGGDVNDPEQTWRASVRLLDFEAARAQCQRTRTAC